MAMDEDGRPALRFGSSSSAIMAGKKYQLYTIPNISTFFLPINPRHVLPSLHSSSKKNQPPEIFVTLLIFKTESFRKRAENVGGAPGLKSAVGHAYGVKN